MNLPCTYHLKFPTKGLGQWNSRVTLFGCETGRSMTQTVDTAAMVGSGSVYWLLGSVWLGSERQKMKFKRDRVAETCEFCCLGC